MLAFAHDGPHRDVLDGDPDGGQVGDVLVNVTVHVVVAVDRQNRDDRGKDDRERGAHEGRQDCGRDEADRDDQCVAEDVVHPRSPQVAKDVVAAELDADGDQAGPPVRHDELVRAHDVEAVDGDQHHRPPAMYVS